MVLHALVNTALASAGLLVGLSGVHAYTEDALRDQIHGLPGLSQQPGFAMFSGYINVGVGKEMFYWFIESQGKPSSDPLLLWTNGGPGCSGLSAFLSEQGPFRPTRDGLSLIENEYSWNKLANMIFIEQPVGVGFSTTKNTHMKYGDAQAAEDNHAFVVNFFKRFPEFNTSDFYISSESYGGHYMPTLARSIVQHNDVPNFRGIKVGNPLTYMPYRTYGEYGTYYGHQLLPKPLWDKWSSMDCAASANKYSRQCQETQQEMDEIVSGLDPYALDFPRCLEGEQATKRAERYHMARLVKGPAHPSVRGYEPCRSSWGGDYLNRKDVRAAIHVSSNVDWAECSGAVGERYNQTDVNEVSMVPVWQWLLANTGSDHRYLIYSGDDDSVCATMGTQQFISDMGFPVDVRWQQWTVDDQVAGFRTSWKTRTGAKWGLTTVHGAGHMVPQTQGARSLALLEAFLSGKVFRH